MRVKAVAVETWRYRHMIKYLAELTCERLVNEPAHLAKSCADSGDNYRKFCAPCLARLELNNLRRELFVESVPSAL